MLGKIASYNSSDGVGIIILEDSNKMNFSLESWNSLSIPEVGFDVFIDKGEVYLYEKEETRDDKIDELFYLMEENFKKVGFEIIQYSKRNLEIKRELSNNINMIMFIVHTTWISILLFVFMSFFAVIPATVCAYFLTKKNNGEHIIIKEKEDDYLCYYNGTRVQLELILKDKEVKIYQKNNELKYIINSSGVKVL